MSEWWWYGDASLGAASPSPYSGCMAPVSPPAADSTKTLATCRPSWGLAELLRRRIAKGHPDQDVQMAASAWATSARAPAPAPVLPFLQAASAKAATAHPVPGAIRSVPGGGEASTLPCAVVLTYPPPDSQRLPEAACPGDQAVSPPMQPVSATHSTLHTSRGTSVHRTFSPNLVHKAVTTLAPGLPCTLAIADAMPVNDCREPWGAVGTTRRRDSAAPSDACKPAAAANMKHLVGGAHVSTLAVMGRRGTNLLTPKLFSSLGCTATDITPVFNAWAVEDAGFRAQGGAGHPQRPDQPCSPHPVGMGRRAGTPRPAAPAHH